MFYYLNCRIKRATCVFCKDSIEDTELVRRLSSGSIFHDKCFKCSVCFKTIETGEAVHLDPFQGVVTCKHDYIMKIYKNKNLFCKIDNVGFRQKNDFKNGYSRSNNEKEKLVEKSFGGPQFDGFKNDFIEDSVYSQNKLSKFFNDKTIKNLLNQSIDVNKVENFNKKISKYAYQKSDHNNNTSNENDEFNKSDKNSHKSYQEVAKKNESDLNTDDLEENNEDDRDSIALDLYSESEVFFCHVVCFDHKV